MGIIFAVRKEQLDGEKRVAVVPEAVQKLKNSGLEVMVEKNAGMGSYFTDDMYTEAGAVIVDSRIKLFSSADIVGTVQCPSVEDLDVMKEGAIVIGRVPSDRIELLAKKADSRKITLFSLDRLPRTTKAQRMDVLTSQASVSGYAGAVIAASSSPRLMPMLTTAAGTVKPSKVLVLGAGVAGLMTISTLRRLGAVVTAYDVRKAAEDEVKSLGGKFLNLGIEASSAGGYARELTSDEKKKQQSMLVDAMAGSDVIVTTASVPGRRAPVLISKEVLSHLRPGTVIVDLSADSGGNCEVTVSGETVDYNGIRIIGVSNPPSHMPVNASEMFSRNLTAFLELIVKDGKLDYSFRDELLKECMVSGRAGDQDGP